MALVIIRDHGDTGGGFNTAPSIAEPHLIVVRQVRRACRMGAGRSEVIVVRKINFKMKGVSPYVGEF